MKTYRLLGLLCLCLAILLAASAAGVEAQPLAASHPVFSPADYASPTIPISALDNEKFLPAVAYNWKHHEYLVVWHNKWGNGNRDIYAQRIDDQGRLKSWFTISSGSRDRVQPAVAYDPVRDRYLVVWSLDVFGNGSDWDIWGKFVPWDGPPDAIEFMICNWNSNQWNPQVAYARAQDEYLVVWTNTPAGVPAYVSGRRVKADGSGLNGGGFTIAAHGNENRVNPDVAYNLARNEYLVVYDNAVDVFGVRLRGDGVALGGGEFGIAGWPDREQHPAVAACAAADQYLVAWQSLQYNHDDDVFVRFIRGDGTPESVHHLFSTVVNENEPSVACDQGGTQYMVSFQIQYSNLSGPFGIRGQRLLPDKTMLPSIEVAAPPAGSNVSSSQPAIAGGGANFLVVWEQDRAGTSFQDIHGRLLAPEALFLPGVLR